MNLLKYQIAPICHFNGGAYHTTGGHNESYPLSGIPNDHINIERTIKLIKAARALGEYIKTLPLTVEQNDRLVHLAVAQVNAAEESGCKYGLALGAKICAARVAGIHIKWKRAEKLNIHDALAQAIHDAQSGKLPIVFSRRNHSPAW